MAYLDDLKAAREGAAKKLALAMTTDDAAGSKPNANVPHAVDHQGYIASLEARIAKLNDLIANEEGGFSHLYGADT